MTNYTTLGDARTAMVNDGLFEAADLDREDEIIEFMYLNDATLEQALIELDASK